MNHKIPFFIALISSLVALAAILTLSDVPDVAASIPCEDLSFEDQTNSMKHAQCWLDLATRRAKTTKARAVRFECPRSSRRSRRCTFFYSHATCDAKTTKSVRDHLSGRMLGKTHRADQLVCSIST